MFKIVKPLRVSPVIKATRWFLLICGIFHGSRKLNRFREIEKTEHVIRENKLREEDEAVLRELKQKTIGDINELARAFDNAELPPGWEEEV